MVIKVIDIKNGALFKAKNDTPIGSDRYCPEGPEVTLKSMQVKGGNIHILHTGSGI